jgi:hypothetical protein
MSGYFKALWGLCWAINALFFSFAADASKNNSIWATLKLCWAYVERFDGHVGAMLGHFDRVLGLCWAISGLYRALSKLCMWGHKRVVP